MTEFNDGCAVSVVVPVYNCHEFLKECLDSLRNQSFGNIEIIVVDDGSDDGSDIIAQEFANTDSRFTLLRQPNIGVGAARNRGLEAASGQWIVFVDADDILLPNAIGQMLDAASLSGANMVFGKIKKQKRPCYNVNSKYGDCRNSLKIFQADKLTEEFLYQHIGRFSICGSLINKRIFSDGLRFATRRRYEDLAITHQLFERAGTITQIDKLTYIYRQHTGSFIHGITRSRFDVLDVTDEIYNHFSQEAHTPALMKAAADRRFSAHCNMLSLIWQNEKETSKLPELENYRQRCLNVIRLHRKSILTNPHVRLKNRLGALLSYNLPLFRFISNVFRK